MTGDLVVVLLLWLQCVLFSNPTRPVRGRGVACGRPGVYANAGLPRNINLPPRLPASAVTSKEDAVNLEGMGFWRCQLLRLICYIQDTIVSIRGMGGAGVDWTRGDDQRPRAFWASLAACLLVPVFAVGWGRQEHQPSLPPSMHLIFVFD